MEKVEIIESEKGWGMTLLQTKEFKDMPQAEKFVEEFNSKNNEPVTPDVYTFARIQEV